MKKGNLKLRLFTKKNVLFVVAFLLVASLTATFCVSCNRGTPPEPTVDEQQSTMLKAPTDGSNPSDYDAKTNVYYALYAMDQLDSFTTESSGETVTKVALASVSQKIKGRRVINGIEVFKENVSNSTFKSVGVKTFVKGDNYIIHNASKVSSVDDVVWGSTASRVSKEAFLQKFGYVPNSITSYILTDETILSAEFLGVSNGIYSFYFNLDTVKSTTQLCLEMRTMAGNKSLPTFEKAAITVRMTKNWQVTEVVTDSVYEVDMLGGVTCTESVVERFGNYNKGVAVPDSDFYNSYVDAEITEPAPEEMTATDYLMAGLEDYLTGTKPLKLNAKVAANNVTADLDATLSLNMDDLSSTSLRVKLNQLNYKKLSITDVLLSYEDSQLYLNAGKFKAKTTVEEVSTFVDSLASMFDLNVDLGLGDFDLESLDLASLMSSATLQETDEAAIVILPLTLGDTTIDVKLTLTKGDSVQLAQIAATIGEVQVVIAPDDALVVPEKGDGHNAITPLLQEVKTNLAGKVQIGDLSAFVNFDLTTTQLDAYVADLAISDCSLGALQIKLAKDTIYANVLGLKAKIALNEVENLLSKLSFAFDEQVSLPNLDAFESIDTEQLLLDVVNSLTAQQTDGGLLIAVQALGFDVSLAIDVTQDGYALGDITANVEGTNITVDLQDCQVPTISNDELANYNDVATLLDVIQNNELNLKVNALDLDIDLNVNLTDFTILAKTTLYGETLYAKIANNKAYVSYKGLNGYVALADLQKVLDKLGVFIGEVTLPDFSNVTAESVIKSLTVTDTDVVTIALNLCGINVNVVLDKSNGLTVSNVTATMDEVALTATPSTKADYTGMTATEYYNLVTLLDVIQNNELNLKVNALDLDIDLNVNLTDFTILAKTTLYGETLYAKIANEKAYVSYKGLNGYVALADLQKVLDKLGVFIGEIELPDFSEISAAEVISSLTVTDTDVVTIALNLCGISANVVLDKTNGLTLSSVTATLQDTEIVATPSTKADYTGMTATEYYNLVTLLDVIQNNELNLKVNALDLDIDLNVNLADFTILAKTTLYGETLYAKIANNKAYVSYRGLNGYVALADLQKVLDKLGVFIGEVTLPDFSNVTAESVIKSLTVTDTDVVTIALNLCGISANVVLDKSNGLTVSNVTATMDEIALTATSSTKADYTGMTATEYYNLVTLLDVIQNNELNLKVNAFDLDIDLNVNLADFTILAKTTLYGETLYAKIANNKAYVSYKGLNGYVALAGLQKVLDKLGVFIGEVKLPDFSNVTAESVIKSLTVTDTDVVTIGLTLNGINANVVLDKSNGLTLTNVTATMDEIALTATPSTKADYTGMTATEYYNIVTLLDVIQNNELNLKVNALDLDIDLNVNLTDFTILAKTTLYGETLYAKIANNKAYVSYKGLNGYVALADLQKVLDKLGIFIGEVTLPDFSNVTAESVIKSLTVTDTDVVTIGLTLNGINANVVLDKSNGLTVSNVTATMDEVALTATPSTKADYTGMTATEYYNLVTLLDILDEDGKVSLAVQAFETTIYLTVDLPNNQILVALDEFEILVDLTENVAYARYPGVKLKLNLDEIEVVLKELEQIITKFITKEEYDSINLDAFKAINVEGVVSSIVLTETQDAVSISLAVASVNAVVTLDKASNGLVVSGGNVKMGAIEATFTTGATPLDFTFDKTATYIGVTELVQTFAPALTNILTLNNLYANMTATLVSGNKLFELTECEVFIADIYSAPKARVNVTLKITTTNDDGTTTVSEHKLMLIYLDPSLVGEGQINTYFTYDNTANADVLAGTFTTVNFNQTLDIVKQIYANMPELQEELKPFIVADDNGMPQFMNLDVDFSKLINSAFFENGILSVDANAKAVLSDLSNSVWLSLFSQNGLLGVDVSNLAFDDATVLLNASVGEAPSGVITADKFEFTPLDTASDFSSINELLLALKNTSAKRHFFIDVDINLAGSGILSWLKLNDKISIQLYLDVIDGKTYFKAIVDRKNVNLVVMNVWSDYSGTGYIYFDPDTQIIYVHNHYTVKGGSWLRPTYTDYDEYLKYTVDEFMQDPLNTIFAILHVSDDLKNLINKETSTEPTANTATIENTFKTYSYNGADTFNITLDLAPLTTDIKKATVAITHDSDFNLVGLNASVNMIDIIDLQLIATLQTSDTSYDTNVEIAQQAQNPNYN